MSVQVYSLDEAYRRISAGEIHGIITMSGGAPETYQIGEISLNEDGDKAYLERCVGHDAERRSFYFRTLDVYPLERVP